MARHLFKSLNTIVIIVTVLFIGVHGNHRYKRSSSNVKCHEMGRFYRNPDRPEEKIWSADECATYYLCLDDEIFEFHCSSGLLFDVNRQLCDKPQNVHNCDATSGKNMSSGSDDDISCTPNSMKMEAEAENNNILPESSKERHLKTYDEIMKETRVPRPLLEEAKCANNTHLGCADNSCIIAEYFCDGANDCPDSSDEGWCDITNDPNTAVLCDIDMCQLPNCFCSLSGKQIPGNLVPSQTPQMVTLTFDGPVNHENWDLYTKSIFTQDFVNPNGCPSKGTFFISHPYTNYRHVQKLWNDGHEIAVNSITRRGPEDWWSKNATVEEWFDEMIGQANVINKFSKVQLADFRGMRVPYLAVGWNRQFLMMQEFGFEYDATVVAPLSDPPFWPYTLDYRMPHNCVEDNQYCPTRSYAGLWEMVINPLVHNESTTCATLEYCPSKLSPSEVYDILVNNFKRHYLKNRAPFGIHLHSTWLKNPEYLQSYKKFITEISELPDVYFVTYSEVMQWIKRPTPVLQIKKFQPWQCQNPKQFSKDEIACLKPNTCKLPSKILGKDNYMITCVPCPPSYPWIRNEFGYD